MNIEERIKALEDEFQLTKEELRQILLDIRVYLMGANTPLRPDANFEEVSAQNNSAKGVESNGNR